MAKKNYSELVDAIYENVGGKDNIVRVAHCITRLRFVLKDDARANTEVIEKTPGVIKVMVANGQYQIVIGNKVEEVYDQFLERTHLSGVGEVGVDDEPDDGKKKSVASTAIDLISGIFQPILGTFSAAGIMKGLLALFTFLGWMSTTDGAYMVLYTIADGFFYFLPVVLGFTAARKFKMSEFNGLAIGLALVYPTTVALTASEVLGTVNFGFLGTFSWYATFFGIPIIMPAAGYTSSVIPVLLMVWAGSKVERWVKSWIPDSLRMFFVPLITVTVAVVGGYLIIGPIATVITNLLGGFFGVIFNLPVVGRLFGCVLVSAFWMPLVIFGFHWSLVPIGIVNLTTLGSDYVLAAMIGHSFSLGAVVFAMYLKNRDQAFREIALPAMISSFFFGINEPAIYGVALPDKRAFVNACVGSVAGGIVIALSGSLLYISGGLGMFNWLSYIDPAGGAGITGMVWAIVASLAAAVVGFAIEFATYKAPALPAVEAGK